MAADAPLLSLTRLRLPYLAGGALDLDIHPGDRVAFLGPESCGKSALLAVMAGLDPPAEGRILLEGRPLDAWSDRERAERIGVLFSDPESRFLTGTVWEEVALVPASRGVPEAPLGRQVDAALTAAGLDPALGSRELGRLSASEAARAAVAALLIVQPRLILVDEPGQSLSEAGEAALAERFAERAAQGAAIVAFTSREARARRFAERIVALPAAL